MTSSVLETRVPRKLTEMMRLLRTACHRSLNFLANRTLNEECLPEVRRGGRSLLLDVVILEEETEVAKTQKGEDAADYEHILKHHLAGQPLQE